LTTYEQLQTAATEEDEYFVIFLKTTPLSGHFNFAENGTF
jgi:hypothetical protein